ncbi:MAG: hypothetical protein V3R29_03495 [Candidatus Acidoferrales bacterium]
MPKEKPTSAQVDLQLRLYELRREAKLRKARDWFTQNFFVEKLEDIERVAPPNSEENTYFRMMVSYWEMVCALFDYGLLHEDFFFETTGEQYMVWVRIQPVVAGWRQQFGDPKMFEHLEEAARRYEEWRERRAPGSVEKMRQMLAAMAQGRQAR